MLGMHLPWPKKKMSLDSFVIKAIGHRTCWNQSTGYKNMFGKSQISQ